MSARGQASIELLGALPLVLAAEAGAVAILQDRDPRAAAEAALPPSVRGRARVSVAGTHVRVRVRPRLPIPGIADRLAATADAEAGPAAAIRPHPVATPSAAPAVAGPRRGAGGRAGGVPQGNRGARP
jgi:hypothetical protein